MNSVCFVNSNTGYISGSGGCILKTTNGGETPAFTVSGTIRFQDNGLTVNTGKVKALKYDPYSQQILTLDSAVIQSNGTYILPKVPQDSVDIIAFQDDEENAVFVPTYYVSTINWVNSTTIFPVANMTDIDINVFRNSSDLDNWHISGVINNSGLDLTGLKMHLYMQNQVLYTKDIQYQ